MNLLTRLPLLLALTASTFAAPYDALIARDKPAAHWSSNPEATEPLLQNGATITAGPRPPEFPAFGAENHAIDFTKPGARVRIADPGADSIYDFKKGESITLEAWVQCDQLGDGQNAYIIGKGRTGAAGQPAHNQNWALRLREDDGTARISFVFRDERNAHEKGGEFWHRWTTDTGFLPGGGWHHLAVTYTFGQSKSVRGYLDGSEVKGAWDMGGATELGPWVDDGEIWLGASMGGAAGSSLRGRVDEVAIHRTALSGDLLKARFQRVPPAPVVKFEELPKGMVRVEILEHRTKDTDPAVGDWTVNDSDSGKSNAGYEASWNNLPATVTETWNEPAFALTEVISKYSPRGVRRDRSIPHLVRLAAAITLPAGEHRVLVRALRGGRLTVDGEVLASMPFFPPKPEGDFPSDGEAVQDQLSLQLVKEMTVMLPGHSEKMITITSDGTPKVVIFETFIGGRNMRPELGQPIVAISTGDASFRLLTPGQEWFDVTDEGFKNFAREQRQRIAELAIARRAHPEELAYWKMRHDQARAEIAKKEPVSVPQIAGPKSAVHNPIDAFIEAKLAKTEKQPSPLIDDGTFLRRATIDTIGLMPTPEQVSAFLADTSKDKRVRLINTLLQDPRWADQWVPYWQDVLAENPAILKATLNNTGPFRFFLHDALRDNWPMDRFVTALVSMEGSMRHGGAASFGVATQNDLPMAEKAQILSSAFLAMEMKCARCHDAPNHRFDQADLFAISAMLDRKPVTVPGTSLTQGLSANSHVVVSLTAGEKIDPHFPFGELPKEPLPGVLRNTEDSREQLAAIMTDPRNERFAQVLVNRLWKRLLGFGIVDPVDDWEDARPSHQELLTWLGRELIAHNYDLKHVARLIMNSAAYQRTVTGAGSRFAKTDDRTFEAPARRRLSAEQLVDSLFQVAGKEFDVEELNFDLDARRTIKDFLNLGRPQRAWEFVGLSNERDRPSLGKPTAQPFMDVLVNFGWRESRPEAKTLRDEAPNVIQPALLGNGILGARITRLSDDSAFTALALRDQPLDEMITQLFQRVLSRVPTEKERAAFTDLLREGYADRLLAVPSGDLAKKARITKFAMWTNHLHPDSTPVVYDLERRVREGDPATVRLAASWRERMEDAVWALIVTPEFTYIP